MAFPVQSLSALAVGVALLSSAASAAITPADLDRRVQEGEKRMIAWRRDFHEHPELSNRETRTAKVVADHLRALGLDVKTGIAHTGVVGVLKGGKPGPVIALRADMDGLPVTERADVPFRSKVTTEYRGEKTGVMHACGHDSHVAMLMSVAEILTGLKANLPGTVIFVFQPAEEGVPEGETGGAKQMLTEKLFGQLKPEVVFGLHVWSSLNTGEIGYRSGPLMAASDRWRLVVTGKQTHGARPWQGVDPIVATAQIITSLQTVVSRQVDITQNPAIVTVGSIKGGIRGNIIPDEVELQGTIRTFDKDQRTDVIARVKNISQHVAAANGATAAFTLGEDPNPVVVNDPKLTERMLPTLRRVAGADNVKQVPLATGAEDFAFFAQAIPSFFYFVGITPKGQDVATTPANHSPLFTIDETALPLGVRSMLHLSVDYLTGKPNG